MEVLIRIGMQVVVTVFGGPPKQALLGARLSQESEHELEHATGRIRAMGEVPMVSRHDTEHAQPIERHTENNRLPCDSGPERREAGQMSQQKRKDRRIDDVVKVALERSRHFGDRP
jgi:hypothetical protein